MFYTEGISKKAKTVFALSLLEFREKEKDIDLYCHVNYMFIKKSGLLKTLFCKQKGTTVTLYQAKLYVK
ncbi:hypothetical protein CON82_29415 [Bacillus wiedmannii]|nr:hypothetical protein CON82_29415 [Bacillus wiedmannii]